MSRTPQLTRKLVLEERVMTPDGSGGFNVAWTPLGTVWADIRATRGSDRIAGGRQLPLVGCRIILRAAPEGAASRPKPDQRLVEGSRVFTIRAVAELNGNPLYLDCWAEEGIEQ